MNPAGQRKRLIAVMGPTASGKSSLAVRIARLTNGEIINCDSMQMVIGMNIGTAKPTPAEQGGVVHHLFDVVRPDEFYSAGRYMNEARTVCERLAGRGLTPVVVGGTGLYFRALLEGVFEGPGKSASVRQRLARVARVKGLDYLYGILQKVDSESAAAISSKDRVRVIRGLEVYFLTGVPISGWKPRRKRLTGYDVVKLGISLSREALYDRINARVREMFRSGLVEEVQSLLDQGFSPGSKGFEAIGYRTVIRLLEDEIDLQTAVELTSRDTRRYAKRQMTWFRSEQGIHWIKFPGESEEALAEARKVLEDSAST